jgi:hypothetical protein
MQLVLGLKGLPGAEMGLVRTILKLSSSLQASWTVTEGDACDVLLLGDVDKAVAPSPGTTVVHVLRRGEPASGRLLQRPIRAEELIELLNTESSRRSALVPQASAAAGGAMQSARLHRWPPFALLNGRPAYVQLATLLSKHPLSAQRLSALAARPLAECEAFMRELDAHNLLAWQEAPAAAPAAPSRPAHPPERRGLLSTLRRKLGIARSPT